MIIQWSSVLLDYSAAVSSLNVVFMFSPIIADAKSLPARRVKGLILLEGKRLVREAVLTDQELKSVFFTQFEVLDGLPIQALVNRGVKLYKVKADHMQVWSDTVTPQGLMGKK